MAKPIKILFVCMGNLCRSPMAEGVFKHHVMQAGLAGYIASDSAGTHDFHVGEPPNCVRVGPAQSIDSVM